MSRRGREVRLARHPVGTPSLEDFSVAEVDIPPPAEDEVVVRNLYTSVDPGQRGLMNGGDSYVATYQVGSAMTGRTVGEVVESQSATVPVGSIVFHRVGWREYAVVGASEVRVLDIGSTDPADHLGVLGHPGLTAWLGMTEVAAVGPGDVVLVSSAAGAVGATAGQLARARGASTVIGTVGSPAKADYITSELGFTHALDYHSADFPDRLAMLAPDGVDVFFDNVGGTQLDVALGLMALHGRIAVCGAISTYNGEASVVRNFERVLAQRLSVQGFLVYDHEVKMRDFLADVLPMVRDGRLSTAKTIFDGVERAPEAFISLFEGSSVGKVLVRLGDREGPHG